MKRKAEDVSRRHVLSALGAAGAAVVVGPIPLIACGARPSCVVTPAQTEGPYFVDELLERADLRLDPTDGRVKDGIPLRVRIMVHRVDGTTCTPMTGAHVDLWQCDAEGIYSGVRDTQGLFDTREKKFLRGYQVTNARGEVDFLTIYPGWYPGRTPHLHFKVRQFAGSRRTYEFTSQLYFDDAVTDRVYARAPYSKKGPRTTRNERDGIFVRAGGQRLMLNVSDDGDELLGEFEIGLRMA